MRNSNIIAISFVVALGGFLFGFDASVISGVVRFIVPLFELTDLQQGLAVSAPSLVAIVGMLLSGVLSDKFGRKRILLFVAFFYSFSAIGSALATDYYTFLIARGLGGLAFGAALILAPMYIAEVSPPENRGQMVSINQLNIVLGFSAAYFCNYLLLNLSTSSAEWVSSLGLDQHVWRWMLGIETLPALLFFLLLFAIPRSPRWLIMKGKYQEAEKVLSRFQKKEEVGDEILEIKNSVHQDQEESTISFKVLFQPAFRFVLILGLIVGIAQQITGVNAIYFYAPSIFEASGIGTNAAFAQAVWVGVVNVVFTVIAMIFIDRWGRKPLLVTGLAGVVICMSLSAYGFYNASYTLSKDDLATLPAELDASRLEPLIGVTYESDIDFRKNVEALIGPKDYRAFQGDLIKIAAELNPTIILVGILGFVASFAISLGPVMWVLFGEMFPNWIRGIAISFVGFINSLISFFVQLIFPWELANIGNTWTFLVYAIFGLISLILIIKLLPETKGKSLETLEKELVLSK